MVRGPNKAVGCFWIFACLADWQIGLLYRLTRELWMSLLGLVTAFSWDCHYVHFPKRMALRLGRNPEYLRIAIGHSNTVLRVAIILRFFPEFLRRYQSSSSPIRSFHSSQVHCLILPNFEKRSKEIPQLSRPDDQQSTTIKWTGSRLQKTGICVAKEGRVDLEWYASMAHGCG
jgi:hypothetical protein